MVVGGVELQVPLLAPGEVRQAEGEVHVRGVQQQQQVVVQQRLAAFVHVVQAVAVQEDPHALRLGVVPVLVAQFCPVEAQPHDVAHVLAADGAATEELAAVQRRVGFAQPDDLLRERQQVLVEVRPVVPADLVVLAVGVVVPALRAADLVAAQQHRRALTQEQGRQEVPLLLASQGVDGGVVRLAFRAAVPGDVVVVPVVAAFLVGVVVFLLVRDGVAQGEAVVGGHEVDARVGFPAVVLVQVTAAGEAVADLGGQSAVALPEGAHVVAVDAVPLGPVHGEVPDLIAALADVPGFGDQLDLPDDGVLVDDREEARQLIHLVQAARQRTGQIEAEAVHVHVRHPVAQAVHDQLQRLRVADVQAVAGAGVVEVEAGVLGDQPVVRGVVDALEGHGGAHVVPFRGVVVHHVQDDLDAAGVQRLDHLLELVHGPGGVPLAGLGAVADVRREERQGAVAPVVRQALVEQEGVVHVLVHGHQFDAGDAQFPQVEEDRFGGDPGVRAAQLVRHVRVGHGQALDVRLVDHGLVEGHVRFPAVPPVEAGVHDDPQGRAALLLFLHDAVVPAGHVAEHAPVELFGAVQRLGVGVEQHHVRVEAQAAFRGVLAVHAVAVALARFHAGQVAVPHEGGLFAQRHAGFHALFVEEAQLDAGGVLGVQGEVGAFAVPGGSQGVGSAGSEGGSGGHQRCALLSWRGRRGSAARNVETVPDHPAQTTATGTNPSETQEGSHAAHGLPTTAWTRIDRRKSLRADAGGSRMREFLAGRQAGLNQNSRRPRGPLRRYSFSGVHSS